MKFFRKKEIVLILFLLLLTIVLSGCDGTSKNSTAIEAANVQEANLEVDGAEDFLIYETVKEEELLAFLNVLDEERFRILDICMNTYYNPDKFSVTYQKIINKDDIGNSSETKEFKIFTSTHELQYKNFLAELNHNGNEIRFILLKTDRKGSFIVIYR